jgi:4-hydroxy-tetrahydrodipicolinate reductase
MQRKCKGAAMTDRPGIVIAGASGRMGQMLLRLSADSDAVRLKAVWSGLATTGSARTQATAMGGAALGVTVTDDAEAALTDAQAVIDFTAPARQRGDLAGLAARGAVCM